MCSQEERVSQPHLENCSRTLTAGLGLGPALSPGPGPRRRPSVPRSFTCPDRRRLYPRGTLNKPSLRQVKVRILDVVYNATSNDLVRTKTLLKNTIVQVGGAGPGAWTHGFHTALTRSPRGLSHQDGASWGARAARFKTEPWFK